VLDRAGWIRANMVNFRSMLQPVEDFYQDNLGRTRLNAPPAFQNAARLMLSSQVGVLVGYLSRRVLGQYDIALLGNAAPTRGKRYFVEHREILVVSNVIEKGAPIGSLGAGELVSHTDISYQEDPPKASMLYALEVPPIWAYATRDELTWYNDWRVGGLGLWDRRCTMHRRDAFDPVAETQYVADRMEQPDAFAKTGHRLLGVAQFESQATQVGQRDGDTPLIAKLAEGRHRALEQAQRQLLGQWRDSGVRTENESERQKKRILSACVLAATRLETVFALLLLFLLLSSFARKKEKKQK